MLPLIMTNSGSPLKVSLLGFSLPYLPVPVYVPYTILQFPQLASAVCSAATPSALLFSAVSIF